MRPTVPYPLDYEITLARIISLRLKALRVQAEALEQALVRLHDADFGACHRCGEPIPFAELESEPTAHHCAACANGER